MLDAQSKTIQRLQAEHVRTIQEANRLMLKYQSAIEIAQATIEMLRKALEAEKEKVKQLECEAIGRSWNATKQEGDGQ